MKEIIDGNKKNDWLIKHIKSEVDIASSDMEVMAYALEDIYEERLNDAKKYYQENPDLLYQSYHGCFGELCNLEEEFRLKEEYEKCSVVKKVINTLKKKFVPGFKQNL